MLFTHSEPITCLGNKMMEEKHMTCVTTLAETTTHIENHIWTREETLSLFVLPFNDLLLQAHTIHRHYWDINSIQLSKLLSIKTGGCGEDCKYCAQSGHYDTSIQASKLVSLEAVNVAAHRARIDGASRLCLGAAWRELRDRDLAHVIDMITAVKNTGLECCVTLGFLTVEQAVALKEAGLDYYNHNIDSSEEYYGQIVSSHTFEDRLNTLRNVRAAGLKICSGGIVGMGEKRTDRADMLTTLANLYPQPESVPINMLVPIPGTPLADVEWFDPLELIRTVAVTRLLMPCSRIRLSAGRSSLSEEAQALSFFVGVNSIFYGDRLLTADNSGEREDRVLFDKLGLTPSV